MGNQTWYGYEIDDALPLTGVSFDINMSTSSQLTATLDPTAIETLGLDPPRDLLIVERGSELVWAGVIWDLDKTAGETLVKVTAGSIWSWYQNKSEVRVNINFTQQSPPFDLLEVPRWVLHEAQVPAPGGPLVIWLPTLSDVLQGNPADIVGTQAQKTGSIVEQMAQQDPGFDFDIKPQYADNATTVLLVGRFYYPGAGETKDLTLELGAGISDYGWKHNGALVANDWWDVGQPVTGGNNPVPVGSAQDATSLATYLRLQGSESIQTSDQGLLNAAAKKNQRLRAKPVILASLALTPGRHDTDLSQFSPGDTIQAVVQDNIVQFDGPFTIASIHVALEDTGDSDEKVERLTLNAKQVQSA